MKKFIGIALAALTAVGLFGCAQDNAEDVSRIRTKNPGSNPL